MEERVFTTEETLLFYKDISAHEPIIRQMASEVPIFNHSKTIQFIISKKHTKQDIFEQEHT